MKDQNTHVECSIMMCFLDPTRTNLQHGSVEAKEKIKQKHYASLNDLSEKSSAINLKIQMQRMLWLNAE